MWKYIIVKLPHSDAAPLNDLGKDGWELVNVFPIVRGQGGGQPGSGIDTFLQAVLKKPALAADFKPKP